MVDQELGVLVPDLYGFGRSKQPPEPWGALGYARAIWANLVEFCATKGYEQLVLVGHSFGGRVAIEMALDAPVPVVALALAGTPIIKPAINVPLGYRVIRKLAGKRLLPGVLLEYARRRWGSKDYLDSSGVMRQVMVKVVNESYEEQFAGLRVPIEMVWGELDKAAPLELAKQAAELNEMANLEIVTGAGHMLPLTNPTSLSMALGRALGRAGAMGGLQ